MRLLRAACGGYGGGRWPISLVHFVTNRCNARCAHCFVDFGAPGQATQELTTREITELTKTLGPCLLNVNLTGGEPFLRPDLFEIAEAYFRNAGVESVYITTNGFYTDAVREFLERYRTAGIRGKVIVSISLDDFEASHDENRRVKGLFARALGTYRMARSFGGTGILANVSVTVTDRNSGRVEELYRALKEEYGVSSITATVMRDQGAAPNLDPAARRGVVDAHRRLTRLIRNDLEAGRVQGFRASLQWHLLNAKNHVLYDLMEDLVDLPGGAVPCVAGRLFGVIAANGDVFPCEMLPGRLLGNVRSSPLGFWDVWRQARAEDCRRFVRRGGCRCHYECALGVGILASARHLPALLRHTAVGVVHGVVRRCRHPAPATPRET